MKKSVLLLSILFAVCDGVNHSKKYTLNTHRGSGFSYASAAVECDSFKMVNTKECIFWNNGTMNNIKSENPIMPNNVTGF